MSPLVESEKEVIFATKRQLKNSQTQIIMKQKLLTKLSFALLLCCTLGISAQTTDYVITVNGSILKQQITKVRLLSPYSSNYYLYQNMVRLVMEQEDGTESYIQLHPLQVEMFFGNDIINGIDKLKMFDGGSIHGKMNLSGLPAGTPVTIFDSNGRQRLSTKTSEGDTPIDTSLLPSGIYIVKAGKTFFKFIKK